MQHRFILEWHHNCRLFSRLCKRVEDMKVWSPWSQCSSSQKQIMRLKLVLLGFNAKRRRIQEEECMSSSAEKRSYGGSSGQDWICWVSWVASVDVSVDEVEVLWHSGIDARATREATAPKAHDAHLHDALGSTTHQRAAIIPLWKHIPHTDTHTCTNIVYLLAVMTDSRII